MEAGPGVAPGFPAYETGEALRLPTRVVWRKRWVLPPQRPRARAARLATGCGQLSIRVSSVEEGGGVAPPRPRRGACPLSRRVDLLHVPIPPGSLRLESHQRFLLMKEAACGWPTQGKLWSRRRESDPRCGRTGAADFRYPTPAGRGRPESHRVQVGHGHPCRTVTLRPRIGVRPGGVAPPSGGYLIS